MKANLPTYRPCWWLRNPHAQTIAATWFKRARVSGNPERLELKDGDFIDLIWYGEQRAEQKVVLILHGLEGNEDSHYVRSIVPVLLKADYRVVFMFHRGYSTEHNRLDRSYHSGETGDLAKVMQHIAERTGEKLYAALGFSLGANALLKYLGEQGNAAPLERAIAVSVPFDLFAACNKLNSGFSRVYQRHLVERLIRRYRDKFRNRPEPVDVEVGELRTFFRFDDQVTAPLNGFAGALDYYTRSSAAAYIAGISKPCLVIHALDDPFLPPDAIPSRVEWPDPVQLVLCSHGGHVGFLQRGLIPRRWLSSAIPLYLAQDS